MKEILLNANEFLASAEDNLKKKRWNASVSDFFKAISNFSDFLIYKELRIFTKNHNERFQLLKKYFPKIYKKILDLFSTYRKSYNLRLKKEDALKLKKFAYELKNIVSNKE